MLVFGISSLASFTMECSCIAPLTPAVIVIRGFVFHPLFRMALISGLYFVCLWERACLGNLSWQYVNSMNSIVWVATLHVNGEWSFKLETRVGSNGSQVLSSKSLEVNLCNLNC